MEILSPREVPLGGLRAMTVRRTLPQRQRSLIGAWCFVDHYGPDDVTMGDPMVVPPHPHTGLATVSWLFTGEIEHRDSAGHHAMVRPGELNLMTAGRGISHSEYSTDQTRILHGCQLWLALPEGSREIEPGFEHYAPTPMAGPGWEARVFLGSLLGSTSPVLTYTPLVGAELRLASGATVEIPVDAAHEFGVLVDAGEVAVNGEPVAARELGYLASGNATLSLRSERGSVLLLLGGPPFGEEIVMWWNFIGRTHEEVVGYREHWQHLLVTGSDERFSVAPDDPLEALNAPILPNVRLRSRR
jgi:redox-sensitive bicupin YhaK (pirin superfamily)